MENLTDINLIALGSYALLLLWLLAKLLVIDKNSKSRQGALVINRRRVPSSQIIDARSWTNRRLGLLNHTSLPPMGGILLRNTNKVHVQGMLIPSILSSSTPISESWALN